MKQPQQELQQFSTSDKPAWFNHTLAVPAAPVGNCGPVWSLLQDLIEAHHQAELRDGADATQSEAHRRARHEALLAVDPRAVPGHCIDLELLVRDTLRAFHFGDATGIHIEGPGCRLLQPAAILVALTLHELATNSIKFGMLGTGARGQALQIHWQSSKDTLALSWRETGVPILRSAVQMRKGFSLQLMDTVLPQHLHATTNFALLPGGAHFTAKIPSLLCDINPC